MVAFCWLICIPLVGKEYVIAGLPPLTGGIIDATMMNQAALEKGLDSVAVLAIDMYVCQGFAGYPLTAIMLKKEGKKLLNQFRSGKGSIESEVIIDESAGNVAVEQAEKKKLIPPVPEKYMTTSLILVKLTISAYISNRLSVIIGLNQAVWALIMGIILTEVGFLDKDSLNKAKSHGFLMFVLMVYVFSGLKDSTPEILMGAIGPMVIIIVIGVAGMALSSMIAGKLLGVSWNMAFAVSLTALYGFPPNYILTEECVKALAENSREHEYLMSKMLPMMLVGGFITVTITSVIIAGLFVNML